MRASTSFALVALALLGCTSPPPLQDAPPGLRGPTVDRREERLQMVATQLEARDIVDEQVLEAMRTVPRHEFVPDAVSRDAYADQPLPIGHAQTISQPYIVAIMTQLLRLRPGERVLEIGTGSGYQTAILAEMDLQVYSIEIVCPLHDEARERLDRLGYGQRVVSQCGDGYRGWPEHAPFDAVIITAAPPVLPQALIDQLAPGGRLIVPEGELVQELVLVERHADNGLTRTGLFPVRFVPMVPGDGSRSPAP